MFTHEVFSDNRIIRNMYPISYMDDTAFLEPNMAWLTEVKGQ